MRTARGLAVVTVAAVLAAVLSACSGSSGSSPARTAPATAPAVLPTDPDPTMDKLVWSDEFGGTSLDTAKWTALHLSTYGDGNQELACLTDRAANVQVSGGYLHLIARAEKPALPCGNDPRFPDGRAYSSAMLTTQNTASWDTGRFEIRAKLPITPGSSAGLWPAFWLRPVSGSVNLGEIDVLEGRSSNGVTQTCHQSEQPGHQVAAYRVPSLSTTQASSEFHVYGVEWTADRVVFSVDGHDTSACLSTNTPWISQALMGRFFLRLNLAVGGRFPGDPTAQTTFPQTYLVDWVRVYQ